MILLLALVQSLAIENVTVIPMDRDTALANHSVLVTAGRISWIGPTAAATVPRDMPRVDGSGRFLLPGLADMHVHLRSAEELPIYLAAGITTIRNMNGLPMHLVWRNRVARGILAGPRIYTAGPSIGRGFVRLRTPAEADSLVQQYRRAGYDFIKVLSQIELPVYERLLASARVAQLTVVGHVVEGIGPTRALAAGQLTFEHANIHMFEGGLARLDEGARAIARAGTWVGTLAQGYNARCEPPHDERRRVIAALRRANVKLLAGADAGIDPIVAATGLHCELATLVAAGLTPYEALSAATRNAGEFARLHLEEQEPFGTIAVGSRADFVLLAGDPRADIGAVTRPVGTVLRGVWRPR